MYNLISIKAFLSASMQRSNKLLCLFIALFINSTYSAISIIYRCVCLYINKIFLNSMERVCWQGWSLDLLKLGGGLKGFKPEKSLVTHSHYTSVI